MKIVYITTGLSGSGAEIMLYNLPSNINRNRFESTVISLMNKRAIGERIEKLIILVHFAEILAGKPIIASARRIIELIKKIQPDLIQGKYSN